MGNGNRSRCGGRWIGSARATILALLCGSLTALGACRAEEVDTPGIGASAGAGGGAEPTEADSFASAPVRHAASTTFEDPAQERGIGVLAFRTTESVTGADTLLIRTEARLDAPLIARLIRGTGAYGDRSFVLDAPPGSSPNLVEYAYEEAGVPFDTVAGAWVRVVPAQVAGGDWLRGWVRVDGGRMEFHTWPGLLTRYTLYHPSPDALDFRAFPDGPARPVALVGPDSREHDYDLFPVEQRGRWLRVRVTVPSACSGIDAATEEDVWVQHLDLRGRPLLWPRTRGC